MKIKMTGYEAIEFAKANDRTLNKYNDPTEDAREGLTIDEARRIAKAITGIVSYAPRP